MDNIYLSTYGLAEISFLIGFSGHHSGAVILGEGALHLAAEQGFVIEHLYLSLLEQGLEAARGALGQSEFNRLSDEAKGLPMVSFLNWL